MPTCPFPVLPSPECLGTHAIVEHAGCITDVFVRLEHYKWQKLQWRQNVPITMCKSRSNFAEHRRVCICRDQKTMSHLHVLLHLPDEQWNGPVSLTECICPAICFSTKTGQGMCRKSREHCQNKCWLESEPTKMTSYSSWPSCNHFSSGRKRMRRISLS